MKLRVARKNERRRNLRLPIVLSLTYKVGNLSGNATSLNIGSRGMLIVPDRLLPTGETVECSLPWPAELDGVTPLRLWTAGKVLRSDSRGAALSIGQYEFKTCRKAASVITAWPNLAYRKAA